MTRIVPLTVILCVILFVSPVQATPLVQVSLHSERGDFIGQGQDYFFTNTGSPSTLDLTHDGLPDFLRFFFFVPAPDVFWGLDIATNQLGLNLNPGFYPNAQRASFAAPGHPGLDFTLDGRGSNTVTGQFTILDIAFSGATVVHFSADFEQHSEGAPPALFGHITYTADTPVPEPSTLFLLGSGLAGLAAWRRRWC